MPLFLQSLWQLIYAVLSSEFFLILAAVASVVPFVHGILKYVYKPLKIRYSPRRLRILESERNYLKQVILQMDQLDRATYWEDLLYTPLEAELNPRYLIPPEFTVLRQPKWVKEMESPLEPPEPGREKYSDILTVFKEHKEPLVILGDPGAGKSVSFRHALRQIATGELRWYRTAPLIPVYIPCGHYTETSNNAPLDVEEFLTKYVSEKFKASGQGGLDFKEFLAQGRLVLFFDALDEMPRNDYAERTRLLRLFAERFSHNRIFFSCRKLDYDKRLQATEVTIRPFDRGRRRKFLKKALAKSFNRKAVLSLIYKLETDAQTGELLSNPFFCQLVVFYITALRELPTNRYQLFSLYIQRRLSTESERGSRLAIPSESVILVLSSLAYVMSESKGLGTAIPRNEASRLVTTYHNDVNAPTVLDIALEAKLLIESGNNLLQFAHHRLQEYFAALYATRNISWSSKLVSKFCDDLWWREILIMMMGMGEGEGEKINTIVQTTLDECRQRFHEILNSLEPIISAVHSEGYSLTFAEDLRQKESYLFYYLAVFDPYADNKELVENLMFAERICGGTTIPYRQRERYKTSERPTDVKSTVREWLRHLEEFVGKPRKINAQLYNSAILAIMDHLSGRRESIRALRRVVVNRIGLSLACATNAGIDTKSEIWRTVKEAGLILVEKGTPIEQVRIAKEFVVHDNDVQIAKHLRRLLTGQSNWVASEIFAALLSFRIPHVGYDSRSIRYLWNEIDRHGAADMLQEFVPRLARSFVRAKSLIFVFGLAGCHLAYVAFFGGVLPWTAYLFTTLPSVMDFWGWDLIIKGTIVSQVCFWTAIFLVPLAFVTKDIRVYATFVGIGLVMIIFWHTSFLNEQFHQSQLPLKEYLIATSENPIASSEDITKYVILGIVGLLLLIKVLPLTVEYIFYAIQVLRLQRFKRSWSQRATQITDKREASSAALEFYTTFNSSKSKLLIIDFLWETAEFDRELINRLTDLASNEKQTELSDRLWNLIYELETREQRVA